MPESIFIKSNIKDYSVDFRGFEEALAEDLGTPAAVILDQNVGELYAEKLDTLLKGQLVLRVEALETNKTLAQSQKVIEFLTENGFKRNHQLIAIGGGIIQDLTCFTASVLFRGIPWRFYPTTLLAQCDSCIGSKSSINVGAYKNLAGNFYPPEKVTIDVNFTDTLKPEDVLSGLGEAIKVHYLDEKGRQDAIYKDYAASVSDRAALERVIYNSLLIKKDVIEIDEYDRDYRNIMNYGHTFGHALESLTDYGVPHGIAVTYGLEMANYMSRRLDMLSADEFARMQELTRANVKPVPLKLNSLDGFWPALQKDKKNVDHRVNFVLTRGFGKMFKHKLALDDQVRSIITDYFRENDILHA